MQVKALSLKQPWASLIRDGKKTIETRKWKTAYRGDILICSSQTPRIEPFGKALCIVELVEIIPMSKEHEKNACFNLYPGAQAWFIKNLRVLKTPFPIKGQLNLFTVEVPDDSEVATLWKSEELLL